MIDKVLRIGTLLDYYDSFLTKVQCEQCRLHFEEDYSIVEIAEMHGVSRQAVFDAINRAVSSLEELDSKLGLVEKSERLNQNVERLSQVLTELSKVDDTKDKVIEELTGIKNELKTIFDEYSEEV